MPMARLEDLTTADREALKDMVSALPSAALSAEMKKGLYAAVVAIGQQRREIIRFQDRSALNGKQ